MMRRALSHGCLMLFACALMWDYVTPPPEALVKFRVYLSATSGGYDFQGEPVAEIEALPEMKLSLPCDSLPIWTPGPWHLVTTAVARGGEQSVASNEIVVYWGPDGLTDAPVNSPGGSPGAPLPPPQGIPPVLPPPIVLTPPAPSPSPWTPTMGGASGSGWLTETCQWRGSCR